MPTYCQHRKAKACELCALISVRIWFLPGEQENMIYKYDIQIIKYLGKKYSQNVCNQKKVNHFQGKN